MRGPLELRLVLATLQDVRLGLHQLRLEASSCSAQELTAPDTEHPATGLACHGCWHGEGTASRTGLPCRQPARPPGMATGGRPTHRRAAPGARAEEIMAGSSAVSVGATPLGPPGQPSRSPPAIGAMTWFLTRSCSTCASQSWPGAHRHHQPADQLLPPGRGILVKVDAGQLPESITAEI